MRDPAGTLPEWLNLPPLHTDGKLFRGLSGEELFLHVGWDGEYRVSRSPRLYWRRPSPPFNIHRAEDKTP